MTEIFSVEIHTDDLEVNEIAYSGNSFFEAKEVFYRLLADESRPFFMGCANPTKASVIYASNHDYLIADRRKAANTLRGLGLI